MRTDLKLAAASLIALALLAAAVACRSSNDAAGYDVSVQFTAEVTQADMDDVHAFLRTFDDDLGFLIMEIFPLIGRASVSTDAPQFCETAQAELAARSYVESVTCEPATDGSAANPDAPVSDDNGPRAD